MNKNVKAIKEIVNEQHQNDCDKLEQNAILKVSCER